MTQTKLEEVTGNKIPHYVIYPISVKYFL